MKKQVRLPSGDLGSLGTINIDLEMKAKHYDALTLATGDHNEEVVLSILKDLMEEDPYKLAQIDMMYVFTLVKIATIGSKLTIKTSCPNKILVKSGVRICNAPFSATINLTEDDCIYKEPEEQIPTIELTTKDGQKEVFSLQLPTMAKELELLGSMESEGHTRRQILTEKDLLSRYGRARCALHLKSNTYTTSQLIDFLAAESYATVDKLNQLVLSLNSYGLKHKKYTCQCKECGGTFEYHLPLFFGLSL